MNHSESGYYRFPTICNDTIVFVCEDDLWAISRAGGLARRLTAGLGEVTCPLISPDGEHIAFTGREEGPPEVFLMPAAGGPAKRVTFAGATVCTVAGWDRQSRQIIFASNSSQPFARLSKLFSVDRDGGLPRPMPYGPANNIAFGPKGAVVGRNTRDPARWKRYRGGTCGHLWVDPTGKGNFRLLISLDGNMACPMWIKNRIYFISDHQGVGNVYSCRPSGGDLRRHTDHETYYARNASSDGQRVVYHAGADLYVLDCGTDRGQKIDVQLHSPRTQRNRKFVSAATYLESYHMHPQGHSFTVISRGKPFSAGNGEGPIVQHGEPNGVRYRHAAYLKDGKRLVAVTDRDGEDSLIVFHANGTKLPQRIARIDIGRPVNLVVCPKKDLVALDNHRRELIIVDLQKKQSKLIDTSKYGPLNGIAWSPDGRWLAYAIPDTTRTSIIKLCNVRTRKCTAITQPVLWDVEPSFDPDGNYLYFLSHRVFDPVYDNLHFDLNFPRGMRPYLVTLRKDVASPFLPKPRPLGDTEPDDKESTKKKGKRKGKGKSTRFQIDLNGIENRIVPLPVPEGIYDQIWGLPKGKVLFTSNPVEGSIGNSWSLAKSAKSMLEMYNLPEQNKEHWLDDVTSFSVSSDGQTLIYSSGDQLRIVAANEKPKSDVEDDPPGRKSGWVDLDRVKVSVNPPDEWRQMYREAWRLQRDHFWTADMSGVDWKRVYDRYFPLLDRITSRSEFSDLIWEMQGELGTSHAYELGGDYRPRPQYQQGFLGADFQYVASKKAYKIQRIFQGDVWEERKSSPLCVVGANIESGDWLLAIGGKKLSEHQTPAELLVNQAGNEVQLTVARGKGPPRIVAVKPLHDESSARYREWVEANRRYVHKATSGRAGYVHIPDMGPRGYAEFHRYYLSEIQRDALVIDVRFNGGGHVSPLILEKLLRRRIGYDLQRWGQPEPYPSDSVLGPKVAITNQWAGSGGDIFSHCFKLMKLGPLIGKRTWGGVIGIWPRHPLVDGSITTQPEFSFWFQDVGWRVENYGTDPDIDIDITPQDDAQRKDPQIDRAIAEILKLLRTGRGAKPSFTSKPRLPLPKLPRR